MINKTIRLYEDRDKITLTTYIYEPSLEMIGAVKRPAVLICPGGAYFNCSDAEGEPVALTFASMGYQAFVLKYSTYGADAFVRGLKNLERRPQTEHPAPVRDIAKAMLMIKDHADEWNVDPDRIAICGFSAGAHNCAMYSVYWDKPLITEFFGREAKDFRPAAAVLCYPLTDYVFMKENMKAGSDPMNSAFFAASNLAFTGAEMPDDAKLLEISPARLVSDSTPPMFIWSTSEDQMVPVTHSLLMAGALSGAHIPYELHIFERGQHGLSTANQAAAAAMDQINPDAAKWVPLADAWLRKRFSIQLPPTMSFDDVDASLAASIGLEK